MSDRKKYDDYKKQGVDYTPSTLFEEEEMLDKKTVKKRKTKPAKSQYGLFMGITIAASVLCCVIVFFLVYNMMKPDTPMTPVQTTEPITLGTDGAAQDYGEYTVAVINSILPDGTMNFIEALTDKEITGKVLSTTEIKDKYGKSTTLSSFRPGDIVSVETNESGIKLLKHSSEVFEFLNVTDFTISQENKTIMLNNKAYVYSNNLKVTRKDRSITIDEVDSKDSISIRGYKNQVLVINIEKSNGTLTVKNYDKISDISIEISNLIYSDLKETQTFDLPEGIHSVTVRGSNIDDYIKDIRIEAEGNYDLDLSTVQPKTGALVITANVTNYTVLIDGTENTDNPIMLPYGKHVVTIAKDGYSSYEREVYIKDVSQSIDVQLTEQVKMARLFLETHPTGAKIYIDSAYVGEAPVEHSVTYGVHTITVKAEMYKEFSVDIDVQKERDAYRITIPSSYAIEQTPQQTTESTTQYDAPVIE